MKKINNSPIVGSVPISPMDDKIIRVPADISPSKAMKLIGTEIFDEPGPFKAVIIPPIDRQQFIDQAKTIPAPERNALVEKCYGYFSMEKEKLDPADIKNDFLKAQISRALPFLKELPSIKQTKVGVFYLGGELTATNFHIDRHIRIHLSITGKPLEFLVGDAPKDSNGKISKKESSKLIERICSVKSGDMTIFNANFVHRTPPQTPKNQLNIAFL